MANLIHASIAFPVSFSPIPWDSSRLTSCISALLPKFWCQAVQGLKKIFTSRLPPDKALPA